MMPMIYFRQILNYGFKPEAPDLLLGDVSKDKTTPKEIFDLTNAKKRKIDKDEYLFIYRMVLKKIIEILDCILIENNQKEFIQPYKNINIYYPIILLIYNHIGVRKYKFIFKQLWYDASFNAFETLSGDNEKLVKKWKKYRSKYLNYLGIIENQFAIRGFKEYEIPLRLKIIISQIDEILEFQRSQYSPIKTNGIQLNGNIISYKDKKIPFNKKGKRLELIKLFYKNPTGISSKEARQKLNINLDTFKANIRQINNRIKDIKLTIRYDKNKKLYLLTTI